jgi:hypothetical protein
MTGVETDDATVDPAVNQMARFVVMYDTPSDVDAFERHYNDVHIPLANSIRACFVTRAVMSWPS